MLNVKCRFYQVSYSNCFGAAFHNMTVIKVVKDELPFVLVIRKKLLPCMGLNVASLILECFMLSITLLKSFVSACTVIPQL